MKILTKNQRDPVVPWDIAIEEFKGTATLLDDVILGDKFAKESTNLYLTQDGRWSTRPGTMEYGSVLPSNFVSTAKYIRSDGTQELLAIGADGKGYKSTDGGAWTEITGATFSTTAVRYSCSQAENVLFIANGVDRLTRYDGSTFIRYTPISTPSAPSGARNVLTAGSYANYYAITALNDIGETVGSASVNVTTNKRRNEWDSTASEYLTISWSAVTDAVRYQVYYGESPDLLNLLADTMTAVTTYKDDATAGVNPYSKLPTDDSTGAPAFRALCISDARLWGVTTDSVWWSGVGDYVSRFGASYGGGYEPIIRGTGETFEWVGHFRDGKGNNVATTLVRDKEGVGSAIQISFTQFTVATTTFFVPTPTRLPGPMGTVAPNGVVEAVDSLFIPNERGIFALNNKANIQNILSTDELSGNIRPSYRALRNKENIAGIWYDSKVFFSASEGGNGNDIVFIYDTERREWVWKWTIGFRQFIEVTNSDGVSRLLGVPNSGTKLLEISERIKGDSGTGFYQAWMSGLIPVSSRAEAFALVKNALIELGRPEGIIYFEILGVEKDRGFASLGTAPIEDAISSQDFTNGLFSEYMFGEDEAIPEVYASASTKRVKRMKKTINAIQFRVWADSLDAVFTIIKLSASGTMKKTKIPRKWIIK